MTQSAQTEPTYLSGLHYFCDHRCWRCPLSHRCRVFVRLAQMPDLSRGRPQSPAARVAAAVVASLHVTVEDAGALVAAAPLDTPVQAGPETDPAETEREFEEVRRQVEQDPLVARGKEYAGGSLRVLQSLRPSLARKGDAGACDAAERLEETCLTIASKIFRAVSSAASNGDASESQSDANGSAKVALLLIEESRQAWRELMQPGRAVGNGAPSRFVRVLDGLEAGLLERFPRAFEFVRLGFDTGHASDRDNGIAQALLHTGRPGGDA